MHFLLETAHYLFIVLVTPQPCLQHKEASGGIASLRAWAIRVLEEEEGKGPGLPVHPAVNQFVAFVIDNDRRNE